MPRIRVRTIEGERIVGTSNCSMLTIRLISHAQRSSLQLQADAQLVGGNTVIEHWSWDFPELPAQTKIELIPEPVTGPLDFFDPPDASHSPKVPVLPDAQRQVLAEIQEVEREFRELEDQLSKMGVPSVKPASDIRSGQVKTSALGLHCSFCGKKEEEVRHLIAGPSVYICDECIDVAHGLIRE